MCPFNTHITYPCCMLVSKQPVCCMHHCAVCSHSKGDVFLCSSSETPSLQPCTCIQHSKQFLISFWKLLFGNRRELFRFYSLVYGRQGILSLLSYECIESGQSLCWNVKGGKDTFLKRKEKFYS